MEASGEENEEELEVLPPAPVKPQKTLFSYFNVDKRSIAVVSEPDATAEKKNSGSRNGISIALFGRNAAKKMGRTTPKNKKNQGGHDSNSVNGSAVRHGDVIGNKKENQLLNGYNVMGEEDGSQIVNGCKEGDAGGGVGDEVDKRPSEHVTHFSNTSDTKGDKDVESTNGPGETSVHHAAADNGEQSPPLMQPTKSVEPAQLSESLARSPPREYTQSPVKPTQISGKSSARSPRKKSIKSPVKPTHISGKSPSQSPRRTQKRKKPCATSPLVTNSPVRRTSRRAQGKLCFDSSEDEGDKEQSGNDSFSNGGVVSSVKRQILKTYPLSVKIEECEDEDSGKQLIVKDEAPSCHDISQLDELSVDRSSNIPMGEEKKPLLKDIQQDSESQTMITDNEVSSQEDKETETIQYIPHIGRTYPASSEPSKYRSLIHIELVKYENSSESRIIPEKAKATSKSINDCLTIIQNDNPGAQVQKMFRQLLRCQRDNIMRNLTKMETSKKAVETLWERDTALKNEEMILAEEARLRREKLEKEELRKKMRNDIRMSFKRGGKKKKKTKNDECAEMDSEVDVEASSISKSKTELDNQGKAKGGKKVEVRNVIEEASIVKNKGKKGRKSTDARIIKMSLSSSSNEDTDTKESTTNTLMETCQQVNVDHSKVENHTKATQNDPRKKSRRKSITLTHDTSTKKAGDVIVLDECTVGIEKMDMKKYKMKKKIKSKKQNNRLDGIRCYMQNNSSVDTNTKVEDTADNALSSPVTGSDKENTQSQDSLDNENLTRAGNSRKRKMRTSDVTSKKPKLSETTPRRMSMRHQSKAILTDNNPVDSEKTIEANSCEKKFTAVVSDIENNNSADDDRTYTTPIVDSKREDISMSMKNENSSSLRRSSRVRKPVLLYDPEELMEDMLFEESLTPKQKQKKNEKKQDVGIVIENEIPSTVEEDEVTIVEEVVDHEASKTALSRVIEKLDLLESPRKSPRKPIPEIKLDEYHINSSMTWLEKYQPDKARYVIGDKSRCRQMYDWLHLWKERQECAIRQSRSVKPSRSDSSDSDSEFEEEDFLSNTIVLSGPCGCGMTASVYACANQLDFKVLELNPSMYRTGKNIFDQVSEAVVSHQVRKTVEVCESSVDTAPAPKVEKKDFFTSRKSCSKIKKKEKTDKKEDEKQSDKPTKKEETAAHETSRALATSVDAMSLILFEQVDISYEELDRGFYQGIADLRMLSKRPIILTANNPSVFDTMFAEEDTWIEHIALQYPSAEKLLPMMQLTCLAEQVFIPRDVLYRIFSSCNNDIRKILLRLMFWCNQGKEPLYKKWSSKSYKTKKTPTATDEKVTVDLTSDLDTSVSEESKDVSVVEPPESLLLGDGKGESLIDSNQIHKADSCICSNPNACYSFAPSGNSYTNLDHVAASADNMSQMNSILHRDTDMRRDGYYWTSSISDSLCETLSNDRHNASTHWANKLCSDIKQSYESGYEEYIENKSSSPPSKRNNSTSDLHACILQHGCEFTRYHIGRRPFHEDVIPYMKKMCQIEEAKVATMHERKRGNRRYMHYFKTVGLHLEDDALSRLSQTLL